MEEEPAEPKPPAKPSLMFVGRRSEGGVAYLILFVSMELLTCFNLPAWCCLRDIILQHVSDVGSPVHVLIRSY